MVSEEQNSGHVPATVYEWADLVAKLVHLRIGPPKESHDVTLITEDGSSVSERAIYQSADVNFGVDAIVNGVNYEPPLPPKLGTDLLPHLHGRLSVTVDVFLDARLRPSVVDNPHRDFTDWALGGPSRDDVAMIPGPTLTGWVQPFFYGLAFLLLLWGCIAWEKWVGWMMR